MRTKKWCTEGWSWALLNGRRWASWTLILNWVNELTVFAVAAMTRDWVILTQNGFMLRMWLKKERNTDSQKRGWNSPEEEYEVRQLNGRSDNSLQMDICPFHGRFGRRLSCMRHPFDVDDEIQLVLHPIKHAIVEAESHECIRLSKSQMIKPC